MRRMLLSARMLFGLTMILGTLLIGSAAPASASHGARITIHHARCDPSVWDIFGECHDNRIAGTRFYVAGVWRETDANGVVSWTPGAGEQFIGQHEEDYEGRGAYVYCSNQVTGEVLIDRRITAKLTITTTAGQEVICDWYQLIPQEGTAGATLTIYRTACPPGYEGDDHYADCYDNPQAGVEFATYNQKSDYAANGTTDGSGRVTFQLPGGLAGALINVSEVPHVGVPDGGEPPFAAYCTRNKGQPVDFYILEIAIDPGGSAYEVEIDGIARGDQIYCVWFNLP